MTPYRDGKPTPRALRAPRARRVLVALQFAALVAVVVLIGRAASPLLAGYAALIVLASVAVVGMRA